MPMWWKLRAKLALMASSNTAILQGIHEIIQQLLCNDLLIQQFEFYRQEID
jgi:hypothetical protein